MAKRKKAAAKQRRTIKQYQLTFFGKKKLVGRIPMPTAAEKKRSAEFAAECDEYFASDEFRQSQAREAAAKARHRERIERRPAQMRARNYRLPADVAAFLEWLYENPLSWLNRDGEWAVPVDEAKEMIADAYREGCRQGYIEGRVADLEPKRERSRKANAAKRQRPQDCGGHMMTLDQRDAAIVAEYPTLRAMLGPEEARWRLSQKYDLSTKQVGNVIRKATKNGTA